MLASPEYATIKDDYDRISRKHFARDYFHPEGMNFARSDALFPPIPIAEAIGRDYQEQCRMLCYGTFPSWAEALARFEGLRSRL